MTQRHVVIGGCLLGLVLTAATVTVTHLTVAPRARDDSAAARPERHADGMLIVVDARNQLYIEGVATRPDDLVVRVRRAMLRRQARIVYLKPDRNARYAAILEVMEALHEAHIDVRLI